MTFIQWLKGYPRRPSNLCFDGGGRVSVDAKTLARSEEFKRTVRAIRELRHAQNSNVEKP